MPIIAIPSSASYIRATPEFIDNAVTLQPPLGGVTQRLNRLGSRWALSVEVPPQREGSTALLPMISALVRARAEGGSYPWPQPGFTVGSPGTVLVRGAGQTGTVLLVQGATPGYQFRAGQAISILTGGRRYLHIVQTDAAPADGSTNATLSLFPMLRVSPTNLAPIEVAAPVIEGNVDGNFSWDHERHSWVPLSFRIVEVA